jgi:hypothetical protein
MIKNLLIIFIAIFFASCYATKSPGIRTGMSVEEFQKNSKFEELVTMDGDWMVYKVIYGWNGENTRFYYFKNNKLVKMDSGERAADYRIRIDTN